MGVTLRQKKANMAEEAHEIEKRMDAGRVTPEDRVRYAEIQKFFADLNLVEKPDSMAKKAKMEDAI